MTLLFSPNRPVVDVGGELAHAGVAADLRVGANGIAIDADATKLLLEGELVCEIGKDIGRELEGAGFPSSGASPRARAI